MILKKPYAFLIKYFKVIHLILLVIILYITFKFNGLVRFFSDYISNNNIINITSRNDYIPVTIFLALIIVLVFSILMWLLMYRKRKPNQFYLFAGIYYFILLVAIIYAYNLMGDLIFTTLTQRASRAYRDIYQILFFPNLYFLVISLIRGIGFDVKKFNFSKDLEELEIKSEDNEEFEFVLGNDTYKIKRKARRFLRELKYYIKENKVFITIIVGAVVGIGLISLFLNATFFNKTYSIGSTLKTDNNIYTLKKAYITEYDISGKKIKDGKQYLILDLNIKSIGTPKSIKSENFYIKKNNKVYNYISSLSDSFSDLGVTYKGETIPQSGSNYIFVFELDSNTKGKYELKIFNKAKTKNNNIEYLYKVFSFRPTKLDSEYTTYNKNLNDTMTFDKTIFGKTSLVIKDIKITNSYEYTINSCDANNTNCTKISDLLFPLNSSRNDLLVIQYDLNIDTNAHIYNAVGDNPNRFFDRFLKLTYTYNNKTYITAVGTRSNSNISNIIIADISKAISDMESINLNITTRNQTFTIKIK